MGEYDKKSAKAAPTAGAAQDDRYGAGKVGTNMTSRILKYDIVGGRALITIAKGKSHGAQVGMEGYIKGGAGGAMLSEFQLHDVGPAISHAFVDVTFDQLQGHLDVVINPTTMPRLAVTKDTPSRVIDVSVEGGRTKIIIARGSAHGVTRGMRGELRSADGSTGDTFTIEGTTAMQSYAYVASNVDHVHAHGSVVLHPNASARGPVQRRANGASSTADVQSTAQAGVAGAASRLPHFDTIQRAFGKHDISGIQAQVGGPAVDASRSLGAQAYATGNKVAFASAPDLHTAAHEAAHTVQQSRGAVGFQGLGAADDEHERHADAVADAVVAGRSAEPLLDDLSSHESAREAVQLKPVDNTASKRSNRYVTIQSILEVLEHRLSATPDKAFDVFYDIKHHLNEVSALLREARADLSPADVEALGAQLDNVSRAIELFRSAVAKSSQPVADHLLREVVEVEQRVRAAFGLDARPLLGPSTMQPAGSGVNVVESMLRVAADDCTRVYGELIGGSDRDAVLETIRLSTARKLSFAHSELLKESDASRFLPQITAVSRELLRVRRLLSGRDASAHFMSRLAPAVSALDALRSHVGLGEMIDMDTPQLSEREHENEASNEAAFQAAKSRFDTAMASTTGIFALGASRFETFAALKRPPPQTDAFAQMLLSYLLMTVVNQVAPGLGPMVRGFVAAGKLPKKVGEDLSKFAVKTMKEKASSHVKKIFSSHPYQPDGNESIRERKLFAETIVISQTLAAKELQDSVSEALEKKLISTQELNGLAGVMTVAAATMADFAYREAMHGYALLQAQKGFAQADAQDGVKHDPEDSMAGYLTRGPSKLARKEGTTGVGKLYALVTQHGENLKLGFTKFEVHGMSDDMAIAVLQRAQYQAARLGIPVEIELQLPKWGKLREYDRPLIVVDEQGQLRSAAHWEMLATAAANRDWARPNQLDAIATPQAFWNTVRMEKVPVSAAQITGAE